MTEPQLILVDELNQAIGIASKTEVHQAGTLHRAFSVFLFTADGRWLMQQRALHKYHSGGLWTNACCSHPQPNEESLDAAARRLRIEMGLLCPLQHAFDFTYKAHFANGLIEHEYDQVYIGTTDIQPVINKEEVNNWKYITFEELHEEVTSHPENFTEWFRIIYIRMNKHYQSIINS